MMDWIERPQDGFSTYEAKPDLTLEPEDLDMDEWSLWQGTKHVKDGTRAECEAFAETLAKET